MSRVAGALTSLMLTACGLAHDASSIAPPECGFGDAEVEWSGTASLNQLGLRADAQFPHGRVGDVFVLVPPTGAPARLFCIVLIDGDPNGGDWTVSGQTPDGWMPPAGSTSARSVDRAAGRPAPPFAVERDGSASLSA